MYKAYKIHSGAHTQLHCIAVDVLICLNGSCFCLGTHLLGMNILGAFDLCHLTFFSRWCIKSLIDKSGCSLFPLLLLGYNNANLNP